MLLVDAYSRWSVKQKKQFIVIQNIFIFYQVDK